MRGNEFLDKFELIDPAYVEAADATPKKKKSVWGKWGALAACLCLVIGGFVVYQSNLFKTPSHTQDDIVDHVTEQVAYGFHLNGNNTFLYLPISFDERKQFGLLPEDAIGLNKENIYTITEDDLGEMMGIVSNCGDEALNGCKVYHFAKYPEKDSICIVETPTGYAFYVCSWLNVECEIGTSSDVILSAYELPESMEKMELCAPDYQHIADIEDIATIESVFEILSGKTNSGLEANERRFAQAWYDAYGNDDVYYSEENGHCMFREVFSDEEATTYTDDEGNTIVQGPVNKTNLHDKASALWTKGECIIQITTERGYQLTIDYFPSIRTFICGNGYYELSASDAEALNQLLQIFE